MPCIRPDDAGWAQVWLQFDGERAYDTIVVALDEAAADWREHLAVCPPGPSPE